MAKRKKVVTMSDLKESAFIKAVKSGNVFMFVEEKDEDKDLRIHAVMDYIEQISELADKEAYPNVNELWNIILHDEMFEKEFEVKKCNSKDVFNKYGVMKFVGVMYELNVYTCKSKTVLHNMLENTEVRTPYYSSMSQGLNHKLLKYLKGILKENKKVEML